MNATIKKWCLVMFVMMTNFVKILYGIVKMDNVENIHLLQNLFIGILVKNVVMNSTNVCKRLLFQFSSASKFSTFSLIVQPVQKNDKWRQELKEFDRIQMSCKNTQTLTILRKVNIESRSVFAMEFAPH